MLGTETDTQASLSEVSRPLFSDNRSVREQIWPWTVNRRQVDVQGWNMWTTAPVAQKRPLSFAVHHTSLSESSASFQGFLETLSALDHRNMHERRTKCASVFSACRSSQTRISNSRTRICTTVRKIMERFRWYPTFPNCEALPQLILSANCRPFAQLFFVDVVHVVWPEEVQAVTKWT